LPLLVPSPSRQNLVDHSFTDQTSILRFIEDNWALPRIGGGSLDGIAGSIDGMFDFKHSHRDTLILDPKASSTGHCPTVRAGAGTSPPWLSSASPRPAD
jgi:phospholipase C